MSTLTITIICLLIFIFLLLFIRWLDERREMTENEIALMKFIILCSTIPEKEKRERFLEEINDRHD